MINRDKFPYLIKLVLTNLGVDMRSKFERTFIGKEQFKTEKAKARTRLDFTTTRLRLNLNPCPRCNNNQKFTFHWGPPRVTRFKSYAITCGQCSFTFYTGSKSKRWSDHVKLWNKNHKGHKLALK